MDVTQNCSDVSDIVPFYLPLNLYLKPIATISVTLQLPSAKLVGKSISNKLIMQKVNESAAPDTFCSLRIVKSTIEFIKFEGELLSKSKVNAVLARLDGKILKLPNYPTLKLRACSTKPDFPTKHDWDSFFRDAKYMNEMKSGERPDTIYLSHVPSEWFSTPRSGKPNEHLLKKTFSQFGDVTLVDIPGNDTYRAQMKSHISGIKLFTDYNGEIFEAYIQFRDYVAFAHAMDTLRGMKLLKKTREYAVTANIKVDFDRTKHLSENSLRKRILERDKLMVKEREKEDMLRKAEEEEEMKRREEIAIRIAQETAKAERRKRREEKRKAKEMKKINKAKEVDELSEKIASEEHLFLVAQRKLESIRLLTELLNRVKEKFENNPRPECSRSFQSTSFNHSFTDNVLEPKYKSFETDVKPTISNIKSRLDFKNRVFQPPRGSYAPNFRGRGGRMYDGFNMGYGPEGFNRPDGMHHKAYVHPEEFMGHPGPEGAMLGPPMMNPIMAGMRHEGPFMRGMPAIRRGRGRGRGEWRGRANWRPPIHTFIPAQIYYGATHDLYYRYFQSLSREDSKSHSRSRSRSRSRSKSRSRSSSRYSSRSSHRSKTRSRSRSKGRSGHRHKSRSRSRRHSRSRSRSSTRSRSRKRSRSGSRRSSSSWSK